MKEKQQTLLEVTGMTCPSCIRHVNKALSDLEGVSKVDVHLKDGTVLIEHDPKEAPTEQLIEALREEGYPSTLKQGAA